MIKNDRQSQLAAVQVRKLERALAELRIRERPISEHRLRKSLEIEAVTAELEGLRRDIAEYASLRAGSVDVGPVFDLVDLPMALIRKRISRGMTQKDLAECLGIAEQQIQRYEANDYSSANLERLSEIAQAVGLQIDIGPRAHLPSLKQIIRRLCQAGFERDFILRRIAPSSAVGKGAEGYARPVIDILARAGRMFGLSPDALIGDGPITLPLRATATAFKVPQTASPVKVRALAAYARYCSSLVLESSNLLPTALPTKAEAMRDQITGGDRRLDFAAIVEYAWHNGIAVLPIVESGGFDAAVFREADGRAVIVLKQAAATSARWMFDILHELAHLTLNRNSELAVIDQASEQSAEAEEAKANAFASDVLLRGRGAELFEIVQQRAHHHGPALKAATLRVAQEFDVPVENLAFDVAYRLMRDQHFDWWAVAQSISRASRTDPVAITLEALLRRVDVNRLSDLDRELFLQAIGR